MVTKNSFPSLDEKRPLSISLIYNVSGTSRPSTIVLGLSYRTVYNRT